jgi:hypothetical protein
MHRKENIYAPYDPPKKQFSTKNVRGDFEERRENEGKQKGSGKAGKRDGMDRKAGGKAKKEARAAGADSELRLLEDEHQERLLHIETVTAMAKYQILFIKMESKLKFLARLVGQKRRGFQTDFLQRLKVLRVQNRLKNSMLANLFAERTAKLVGIVAGAIIRRNKSFAFCRIASCGDAKGGCKDEDEKLAKLRDVLIKLETTYSKLTRGRAEGGTGETGKGAKSGDRKQLEQLLQAKEEENCRAKAAIERLQGYTEAFLDRIINKLVTPKGEKK